MLLRRHNLGGYPTAFRALTGLTVAAFDALLPGRPEAFHADRRPRPDRPGRRRAFGGDAFDLDPADQFPLTVVWPRQYPTREVLGFLFGASDSSALRAGARCLPLLEKAGRDTMRMPGRGRGRRRGLPALLRDTPELAVAIDTFEQRTQRPRRRRRAYDSGKKKAPTLKSQVAVDEDGRFGDVAESRPGRRADLRALKRSGLPGRLARAKVGALADPADLGLDALHARVRGATPRRQPRGRERPAGDRRYNRALARRRLVVEHGLARLRRYQALSQVDRRRRRAQTARVRAAAGPVNRRMGHHEAA